MHTGDPRLERGFTLVDTLVVITIIGTVSAIGVPSMLGAIDRMRLGQSVREVERELQIARSRAVAKGRPMRVRFNCPSAGQYRIVEVIGSPAAPTAADSAGNRCDETAFPYPAADRNPTTRPNLDGPIKRLDGSVTFTAMQTIEFWPDGTAHASTGAGSPWPLIPVAGVTISLARAGVTSAVTVNGLGKIQLQ
ncbi:MAG: pilus assembly FimT family protein [Vicinamibacterales bacterium]